MNRRKKKSHRNLKNQKRHTHTHFMRSNRIKIQWTEQSFGWGFQHSTDILVLFSLWVANHHLKNLCEQRNEQRALQGHNRQTDNVNVCKSPNGSTSNGIKIKSTIGISRVRVFVCAVPVIICSINRWWKNEWKLNQKN